jgi:hypothetical protein
MPPVIPDRLRLPFFILAGIALLICIGLEVGSSFMPGDFSSSVMRAQATAQLAKMDVDDKQELIDGMVKQGREAEHPPGMAIGYTGLLDFLVLYAVLLMFASLVIPEAIQGKIQGIVTLIVSIIVLILAFVKTIMAFVKLMIMVALFMAAPFGTLAYLAMWGFFDKGGAAVILGLTMTLKIAFLVLLALAHQAFLAIKRQMAMFVTTIVATFLIGLLHGFVPSFLVSITDALGAVIVGILIIIWAILLLIGAIISIIKAIL